MFREYNSSEYFKIRYLFEGQKRYTPVHAVINGSFPGRVFVDNTAEPRTAIVWAISRWAYIEGELENPSFNSSLIDLIQRIIIPDSLKTRMNRFELYANNATRPLNKLEDCLEIFNCSKHFESVYVWNRTKYLSFRSSYSHPPGFVIEMAEIPLLPSYVYDVPFVSEDFRSRTAVGFRLRLEDRVVAQCGSNGFTNGKEFMVDVNTFDKSNRSKGYATAAGVGLLDHCLVSGLNPLWETTKDNIASQRLADKLGFINTETYPVFAIECQADCKAAMISF